METGIVRATREDMAEVAVAYWTAYREAQPYLPDLHTPDDDRAHFREVVFARDRVYLARSVEDGAVVGFIAFDDEMVSFLYLVREARGGGLGVRLLDLAKAGSSRLRLWTFQQNDGARRFYRREGFREIRATDGAGNEERMPDVLLEWRR